MLLFAVYNFRNKSRVRVIFFWKYSKFSLDSQMEQKHEKIFSKFEFIAFELVALDSRF